MRKHLKRYFCLWLPAALAAYLPAVILPVLFPGLSGVAGNTSVHIIQWITAAVFLLGWGINTGAFAWDSPRSAAVFLLGHYGLCLVLVSLLYKTDAGTWQKSALELFAGVFSFEPLYILDRTLKTVFTASEFAVTNILAAVMAVGYFAGLIFRKTCPDPSRPRFYGR